LGLLGEGLALREALVLGDRKGFCDAQPRLLLLIPIEFYKIFVNTKNYRIEKENDRQRKGKRRGKDNDKKRKRIYWRASTSSRGKRTASKPNTPQ
jgi:hypothetical protein